jgi:two-component system sensor histidine kinase CpxA
VNSLFFKTLLALMATVLLTFAALIIAAALNFDPDERRGRPFGGPIVLQLHEAVHAYERGGPLALRAALARFERITGAEGVLTDAYGRDLVTGEDRSELARAVRSRSRGPFFRRSQAVVARSTDDGRYIYFLMIQRGNWFRWLLQPELHVAVLLGLAIVGYFFARNLTNPVRQLQEAVEGFGRGEFRARLRSKRQDELGQLARTFDEMADRIETLLTAERRLLLDISHELRSPLARLGLAVELARSGGDLSKHLDRIQKEADRLNTLVGELLQVTRAEADRSQMHREPVDLADLISGIAEDARVEAEARGARVDVSASDEPVVSGDIELLRRAIENVVRNAIRHTAAGASVDIRLTVKDGQAIVGVRDHGTGVPEASLPHIFDAFYRVEADRNRGSGGVGLGLAIARRAVQVHGGEIRARNVDPGLCVEIVLPV